DSTRLHTLLLDVGNDSFITLSTTKTPLGWIPAHGPLILGDDFLSALSAMAGHGTYTINAARCGDDGHCTVTKLASMTQPYLFVGFVRTA
ncbi:MAG TPA: hypothetical protein VGR57_15925, partial [Ktedonobacterales bacterium]|nr:hypothetical protein [Ktedonobacterales bacterium]